jgi:hypothetical protein
MANSSLENADKPAVPKDASPEVPHAAALESTAKPGDGATNFQQRTTDTQTMVRAGTLPDITIAFAPENAIGPKAAGENGTKQPDKAETRQEQINQLRQVVGDFDLASGIKAENRDAVLTSAVDTANKIAGLPTGSTERKDTFVEAVKAFQKDNPGVDASTFTREMQTVFRQMGSLTLSTRLSSNSVMLADSTQKSDDNPGGVVASVFSGDNSPESAKAKTAFETAQALAETGRRANLGGEIMAEVQFSNFLAGVKDLEPRERPNTPQTPEQQFLRMRQGFGSQPDALLQDVLKRADNLAFSTRGGELGNRFNDSIDELAKSNPTVEREMLGRMMVEGLRTVTQSKDFALSSVNSSVQMSFLQDKRLATEGNPRGTASVSLFGADDFAAASDEFRETMETAKVLQQGITKLGERASKEDINRFLVNVRNDLGNLRSDIF